MDEMMRRALVPTDNEIAALPISNNIKLVNELVGAGHGAVLDIGCGAGKFTRALTALFQSVSGIDTKERAVESARKTASEEGVQVDFRVGTAEALPWADQHFEMVVFSNSLHHMPVPAVALAEACRVLASGGLLYVMEPVAAGNYFRATRLVNDETIVRTKAYEALVSAVRSGFKREVEVMYRNRRSFSSFEDWKAGQIDQDEKRRGRFEAQPDAVRSNFEGAAIRADGQLSFNQVFRIDAWRKA